MAGLSEWVNGDAWLAIKTKFNAVIAILNGGTDGQFFGSNGLGNMPSWKTFIPEIEGGIQGDVLMKLSSDPNDYGWVAANGEFTPITLTGGATSGAGLGYRKGIDGKIELKGSFICGYNNLSVVFTLPVGYRPPRVVRYACAIGNAPASHVAWIEIKTNGEAVAISPATISTGLLNFNLDAVTFYL